MIGSNVTTSHCLEAMVLKYPTKDANHKFLRSLPKLGQSGNTMRTKNRCWTLCPLDDVYNNLVFALRSHKWVRHYKIICTCSKCCFCFTQQGITNKVKSGHAGAYSTCTPSTSSNNIPEREVLAGFADEIDDMDIEEMDINWQIAMIAIRMKKFYKKTGRRVRIDGNKPVGFDKRTLNVSKCHKHWDRNGKLLKEKGTIAETVDSWKNSSKNLWKLVDSEEDFLNKPLYSRFSKTNNFKGVPHPLYGDYTPKPQEEIDDSFEGSFGNPSEHSSESESESISVPNEMSTSKSVTTNEKVVSESKEVEPSCATHVKTPRQQMKNQGTPEVKGKNWNKIMEEN
ncbi:hypothetical protein Tco_1430128 [Tanacetum coccineum]